MKKKQDELGCLERLLIGGAIAAGLLSGAFGKCMPYKSPKIMIGQAPIYENYTENTYKP